LSSHVLTILMTWASGWSQFTTRSSRVEILITLRNLRVYFFYVWASFFVWNQTQTSHLFFSSRTLRLERLYLPFLLSSSSNRPLLLHFF
jgi:hypothetical protein